MRTFPTPEPLRVDAYQAGHFQMIPPGMENFQVAQAIYRKPLRYGENHSDHRIISAGLTPFIKLNLEKPITTEDIQSSEWFYNDFHAKSSPPFVQPYPWPKAATWLRLRPICSRVLSTGTSLGSPFGRTLTPSPPTSWQRTMKAWVSSILRFNSSGSGD